LLKHLAAAAQERGVKLLRFSVRASNHPMLALLQRIPASVIQRQDDVITYEWALPPSPVVSSGHAEARPL